MDIEQLREHCISKADVEESFPFGPDTLVYKVKGKVFLLVPLDKQPLQFNVKCEPERALQLREEYEYVLPGYHMNKKHWNTVVVEGSITNDMIKEFVNDSYDLVLKRKK